MSLALRDIEYLLAVVRAGAISSAADVCGVTQPALTKAVQRVEAELGLKLFERSARGMRLTADGQRVLEPLRRLQADYADTMLVANDMRAQRAGLLRIGVTDTTATSRAAPALAALMAQRPGLRVHVAYGRSDALATLVRAGALDMALVPVYEGQEVEGEHNRIDDDSMVVLVRAGHPLTNHARIGLRDVVPFNWIAGGSTSAAYQAISVIFQRHKLPAPRIVMEVPGASELVLEIIAATDLVTLVPQSFMHHAAASRFAMLPIAPLRVSRVLVLLTRSGSELSPLATALRDLLLAQRRR